MKHHLTKGDYEFDKELYDAIDYRVDSYESRRKIAQDRTHGKGVNSDLIRDDGEDSDGDLLMEMDLYGQDGEEKSDLNMLLQGLGQDSTEKKRTLWRMKYY